MLFFNLKKHRDAFGGRAPPGSARELTILPRPPTGLRGNDKEGDEGMERVEMRMRKGKGRWKFEL